MKDPLVSIIMPAYNAGKTISRAINSVLNQDYHNIVLIVVNDGSTDDTEAVCANYSDRRITIITQNNRGASEARNIGLSYANGILLTFVDSDDWVDNNYISLLVEGICKNNASLSICGMIREYSTYKQYLSFKDSSSYYNCYNNDGFLSLFEGGLMNSCCNKLYKKDIIRNNHLFFLDKIVEDIEFNLKYLQYCEVVNTFKTCPYHYVEVENSITCKVSEEMIQNYMDIHTVFLNNLLDKHKNYANRFVYHQYMSIFMRYLSKVVTGELTKKQVYPLLKKYVNEPLIQQSFDSHMSTDYKEILVISCLKLKLFDVIVFYIRYKQKNTESKW